MEFLSLGLIIMGMFLIVLAIKTGLSLFKQPAIFDSSKDEFLEISQSGEYDVWAKAKVRVINNLGEVQPSFINVDTEEEVVLNRNLMKMTATGIEYASLKLFNFYAETGFYYFRQIEGSSLGSIENVISGILTYKEDNPVSFIVKKRQPNWQFFAFILLCIAGPMLVIGGIILNFAV